VISTWSFCHPKLLLVAVFGFQLGKITTYPPVQFSESRSELKWQPTCDEVGADYWIQKNDWRKCALIGVPAVKPLVAALKQGNDGAARILVDLYKTGMLDMAHKQLILAQRGKINETHDDYTNSSDCANHVDNGRI
jgi:hypothetical protein